MTWTDTPVHRDTRPVGTAGECLPIFTALNGVAAEAIAHRYFRRVYGVCVWTPAVHSPAWGSDHSQHPSIGDASYRPSARDH